MTAARRSYYDQLRDGKLPDGAKLVGRGSRWGNPFRIGIEAVDRADAAAQYAEWLPTRRSQGRFGPWLTSVR